MELEHLVEVTLQICEVVGGIVKFVKLAYLAASSYQTLNEGWLKENSHELQKNCKTLAK